MRLLAHGGTSFAERCRIGYWPAIARGALEDNYGLSGETLAYGLGVLETEPFLIVRQLQKHGDRYYAFSLLLDPGEKVWDSFEWNAASLGFALFGGANPPGGRLLSNPEAFTEDELVQLLEGLHHLSAVPSGSKFLNLLIGSITAPSPIAVSLQASGFSNRPALQDVARYMLYGPPCLAPGAGWLVGGAKEHGLALGARFVIDERTTDSPAEINHLAEAGKQVLSAWKAIEKDPELADALKPIAEKPVWEWKANNGYPPEAYFERILLLSELLEPPGSVDEILDSLDARLKAKGPLEREIRMAAHRLVESRSGHLTKAQTRRLLQDRLDRGLTINLARNAHLDTRVIIEELVNHRTKPSEARAWFSLAEDEWLEIWQQLILTESEVERLPQLLLKAITDLEPASNQATISSEQIIQLIKTALECTEEKNLGVWLPLRRSVLEIGYMLRRPLQEAVRRKVERAGEDWPLDYLFFGEDPGGKHLAKMGLNQDRLQLLVHTLIEKTTDDHLQPDAIKWLAELSATPLRKNIPIASKLQIANTAHQAGNLRWRNFLEVWGLYHGADINPQEDFAEYEREYLESELLDIARAYPATDFVPNLKGLVQFLGTLQDDVINLIAEFQPPLSWKTAARWIDGWEELKKRELIHKQLIGRIVRREMIRLYVESDAAVPQWAIEHTIEIFGLLADRLLFGGTPGDDARYAQRFESLMAELGNRDRIKQALLKLFESDVDEIKLGDFLRRFAGQPEAQRICFECIPEGLQDQLIAQQARRNQELFAKEAYRLFCNYKSDNAATDYQKSVFRFLISSPGESLRYKVGGSYYGYPDARQIDRDLQEIMGISAQIDKPNETLSDAQMPSRARRVVNYFKAKIGLSPKENTPDSPTEAAPSEALGAATPVTDAPSETQPIKVTHAEGTESQSAVRKDEPL